MKNYITALAFFLPALGFGFPPGSPMSEFGPSQVSLGVFYDHSGQDLYLDNYPSILNSTGFSLDYAPWSLIQVGVFGGGGELDVAVPDPSVADTSIHSFNTDYSPYGGASGKLSTPRFAYNTTRAVAFGSAAFLKSSDVNGNSRQAAIYNAGLSIQIMIWDKLNLAIGGEFYAWDGTQTKKGTSLSEPFGLSEINGVVDHLRGVIGVEYFFKGKNRPFISIAFRPTGNIGWHDNLGLRNASISISLGAMASLGKLKPETEEDDPAILDP